MITGIVSTHLLENGKFRIASGKEKVDNDFLLFSTLTNRVYLPDYGQNFQQLLQSGSSDFFKYKNLLLNVFKHRAVSQMPKELSIDYINADYLRSERSITIEVGYSSTEDPLLTSTTIIEL